MDQNEAYAADYAKAERLHNERVARSTNGRLPGGGPQVVELHPGAGDQPDGLPRGFKVHSDGIYCEDEDKDGEIRAVWLCSPLEVSALSRDKANAGWGRVVHVVDPDGIRHTWSVPARLFAGDGAELRAGLLDLGLQLRSGLKARNALNDLLQQWQPSRRVRAADRLGWTDESCTAFVLGDGRVLGDDDIVFQHEGTPAVAAEMRHAGTPADWTTGVASKCAGNPLMTMAVSIAFAGPLLERLGIDGGGVHLRGQSSSGKSTLQRVAVSVWGSPRFLSTWRATANGLEGVATSCNATLLALDELGEVSGKDAGAAIYMLANGSGKTRANKSGLARQAARWRVLFLSSGEISLADKIAEAGGRAAAGQHVRLLDLAADSRNFGAFDELHGATDGAAFADQMKAATATNYGTAGPAFVARLIADAEDGAQRARTEMESFCQQTRTRLTVALEGQVERAMQRLALIAAAGEMATLYGLTGWNVGAARDACATAFDMWLTERGGSGPAEAMEAVRRVRSFIVKHAKSRFENIREDDDGFVERDMRPIQNRAGWCDGDRYFIDDTAWSEIHAGADPRRAAQHLRDAGFLHQESAERLKCRTPRSVEGRPRAYAISSSILGGTDDD